MKNTLLVTTFLLLVIMVMTLSPQSVQAITIAELTARLTEAQQRLNVYHEAVRPAVRGASSITVTNDQELADALSAVSGGETIRLAPGYYGAITIQIPYNRLIVGSVWLSGKAKTPSSPVTITSADSSNRAFIKGIKIAGAANWNIENLVVYRTDITAKYDSAVSLGGDNLKFIHNVVTYGDHTKWVTNQDWYDHAVKAIDVNGKNVEVAYNRVTGVGFGLAAGYASENSYIHHNLITNYSGDAMRGLGKNDRFEHNIIMNATVADGNHDDAFQSWAYDPVTKSVGQGQSIGMVLRFNTVLYSTEDHPLRVRTQGIGLFDGPFKDWIIENNLVVVDHWHGISMYGPVDSLIQNNVSVDPIAGAPGGTWLKFFDKKGGTPPVNARLINNYANSAQGSSTGVHAEGNQKITYAEYPSYFVNPSAGDYTPKPGAFPFSVGSDLSLSDVAPGVNYLDLPPVVTNPGTTTLPVLPPPTPTSTTTPPIVFNYAINDIDGVTEQLIDPDHDVSDDEYTLYTVTLRSDKEFEIKVYGNSTVSTVESLFKATGYTGSVSELLDMSEVYIPKVSIELRGLSRHMQDDEKVEARVTTEGKVRSVEFYVDGDWVNTDTAYPYYLSNKNTSEFDTVDYSEGEHSLEVRVRVGPETEIKRATFTIDNDSGVITPTPTPAPTPNPVVEIVYTSDNLRVRDTAGGDILGIQPKGATGQVVADSRTTVDGMLWIKVDFVTGPDGYVAAAYTASTLPTVVIGPNTDFRH